jgi:sugar phosphate isomerase/epimerase
MTTMEQRMAICQEMFEGLSWDEQCQMIAKLGYQGIEVAPFTLGSAPTELSAEERRRMKEVASEHGLTIIGLHWLLAKTNGYHLTTADDATRTKTAEYLRGLVHLCGDLGGTIMVLGSPLQRNIEEGMTREQAFENACGILSSITSDLEARHVTLCIEPLGRKETNFCNTCAEAVEMIERIGHPNVALHQDIKAMLDEPTGLVDLIHQFARYTSHFHLNDSNLLGPGMGETDFQPVVKALKETNYAGWLSLEVFRYEPSSEEVARLSLAHMKEVFEQV